MDMPALWMKMHIIVIIVIIFIIVITVAVVHGQDRYQEEWLGHVLACLLAR